MARILLCASDPGGARNLAAVLRATPVRCKGTLLIPRSLFHLAPGLEPTDSDGLEADEALELLRGSDAFIAGTCRSPAGLERRLTLEARRMNVPSVAVVDEWYNYRLRFEDEAGRLAFLPDTVALADDTAVGEAVAEGLPESLCRATGSPALAALMDQAERLRRTPPAVPGFLAPQTPVVTFLSETHAEDFGDAAGACGPLGPFLGYTEESVLEALLRVAGKLGSPLQIVEKRHPAAYDRPQGSREVPPGVRLTTVDKTDLWPLLLHSDAVVSMRSMGLLEARMLGRPAASFQPGRVGAQCCTAVRLGLIPELSDAGHLEQWLARTLKNRGRAAADLSRPDFARKDAAEQVLQAVLSNKVRK